MKRAFSPAIHASRMVAVLLMMAASACLAQEGATLFRKAPPEVDASLRQTVKEFLDLQMEKKWGESIRYIASESLDTYIASDKFSCSTMDIFSVTYNDAFNEATVGVICERGMATPVGGGRVKMPYTTMWKLADGDWKWFTPKRKAGEEDEYVRTPFGPIKRSAAKNPGETLPKVTDSSGNVTMGPSVGELQAPLRFEPRAVKLKADGKSSATAVIKNTFAGFLKLELRWVDLDGLTAKISRTELQADETAEVYVEFEPPGLAMPPRVHAVWVESSPMRSATPLMIEFVLDGDEAETPKN